MPSFRRAELEDTLRHPHHGCTLIMAVTPISYSSSVATWQSMPRVGWAGRERPPRGS
jgi:hypothetical protein